MNYPDAYFEAYVDAVKRSRWFILTSVTISALLLAQVALEEGAASKFKNNKDLLQALYLKEVADLSRSITGTNQTIAFPTFTNVDVQAQLDFLKLAHTLQKTSIDVRTVPLLQLEIPSDEYETVLAVVLLIFVVGVWLTIRSIHAPLQCLRDDLLHDAKFGRLVLVHRIFSPAEASPEGGWHTRLIRICALMLPMVSVAIAFVYDLVEHFTKGFTAVQNLPLHLLVLFAAFAITSVFFVLTLLETQKIDQIHVAAAEASASNPPTPRRPQAGELNA